MLFRSKPEPTPKEEPKPEPTPQEEPKKEEKSSWSLFGSLFGRSESGKKVYKVELPKDEVKPYYDEAKQKWIIPGVEEEEEAAPLPPPRTEPLLVVGLLPREFPLFHSSTCVFCAFLSIWIL